MPVEVESVLGAVLFVRREVIERVGLLPEDYFFFLEETDWCWRMRRAGFGILHIPGARALHQSGASSKKKDPIATWIEYHPLALSLSSGQSQPFERFGGPARSDSEGPRLPPTTGGAGHGLAESSDAFPQRRSAAAPARKRLSRELGTLELRVDRELGSGASFQFAEREGRGPGAKAKT